MQKEDMLTKARKLTTMTRGVIVRCCSKILTGKTFWKNVALPSILDESNIMHFNEIEIGKLQKTENGVFRQILETPSYTPIARWEVGAFSMSSRVREGQLKCLRYLLVEGNYLVRRKGEEMVESGQGKWIERVAKELTKN